MEYTVGALAEPAQDETPEETESPALIEPGADEDETLTDVPLHLKDVDARLSALPTVRLRADLTPPDLAPARCLGAVVSYVLDAAPVSMHTEARIRAGRPYIAPELKKRGAKKSHEATAE